MLLPKVPTGLTASNITATSVDLNWNEVEYQGGITEYVVYRDGEEVDRVPEPTYSDSALTASTLYEYQVSAVGTDGKESPLSGILEVNTTA